MILRPLFCSFFCIITAATEIGAEVINVIPRPTTSEIHNEAAVSLTNATPLRMLGAANPDVANWLRLELTFATKVTLSEPLTEPGDGVVLRIDPQMSIDGPVWAKAEGYRLVIDKDRVEVSARTAHGLFHGAATLIQLARKNGDRWEFPSLTITDSPRFQWRGLMLDVGRHFFTVPEVKRFIDLMAFYKYNRFHWHLTEDQGWRIEVKSRPKLTSVGAWRAESPVMGNKQKGDGQPYGGFYTQDDIRTVVAYAEQRFITVVPEIEMPGHSSAAVASYPELGNSDIPGWKAPQVGTRWGVVHRTFSPRDETFAFIGEVFDEILPLFPGEYVHIGGDEAPKDEWDKSPFAQQLIKKNDLKDGHGLQSWFIKRVEGLLKERGKRLIGWDEIQEGGLSPTATMMVWRDWKWATLALQHGNSVVMAPQSHTYFDYNQGTTPVNPMFENFTGSLTIEKVYSFNPIPDGLTKEQGSNVLGAQGQVWTEHIWSQAKVEYMTWPRACALAEVAWSSNDGRSWEEFQKRLNHHLTLLDILQVNYRKADGSPAQPTQSMERTPHKRLP
jgi:hexosaminidase